MQFDRSMQLDGGLEHYIGYTKESGPSSHDDAEEWEKEGVNEPRGAFHLFDEFNDDNF